MTCWRGMVPGWGETLVVMMCSRMEGEGGIIMCQSSGIQKGLSVMVHDSEEPVVSSDADFNEGLSCSEVPESKVLLVSVDSEE